MLHLLKTGINYISIEQFAQGALELCKKNTLKFIHTFKIACCFLFLVLLNIKGSGQTFSYTPATPVSLVRSTTSKLSPNIFKTVYGKVSECNNDLLIFHVPKIKRLSRRCFIDNFPGQLLSDDCLENGSNNCIQILKIDCSHTSFYYSSSFLLLNNLI